MQQHMWCDAMNNHLFIYVMSCSASLIHISDVMQQHMYVMHVQQHVQQHWFIRDTRALIDTWRNNTSTYVMQQHLRDGTVHMWCNNIYVTHVQQHVQQDWFMRDTRNTCAHVAQQPLFVCDTCATACATTLIHTRYDISYESVTLIHMWHMCNETLIHMWHICNETDSYVTRTTLIHM